jgi:exosortase family protein XrtF
MLIKRSILSYKDIPPEIAHFFVRAATLLGLWLLVYHGLLKPSHTLDQCLTIATTHGTVQVLNLFYNIVHIAKQSIYIDGKYAVSISDPCNALELIVLYVGFLFCVKTTRKRLIAFTLLGTISIYTLNIFRCAGLAYLNLNHFQLTNFAHHYVFKLIIYCAIFLGWALYAKKEKAINEPI